MSLCNKNMTALQRRSMQRLGGAMLLMVLTNFASSRTTNPLIDLFPVLGRLTVHSPHPSILLVGTLAVLSVLPVLLAVWIVGTYLKAEPDEFVRALIVQAILWGIAVTMAGDAIAGVITISYATPFPIGVLNADLLFASTGIAFRLLQRSYR
jgi:hypothetical protein